MDQRIMEIAERIRELRDVLEISVADMAAQLGTPEAEYREYEAGNLDFSFTFLYRCAQIFHVDIVELLTGEVPKLSFYTVVRAETGLPIKRRKGFSYHHLAYRFKGKMAEPFLVTAPYSEEAQNEPMALSYHAGQEFDYVLEGSLKVQLEDYVEILHPGDAIYYDSGHGHGMVATGGSACTFLAFVIADQKGEEHTDG